MRFRPLVAGVVLALSSPAQCTWALAVLVNGSHHLAVGSVNGRVALVLHHHAIPSGADEATVDAGDHPHRDHVIHGVATDRTLAASRQTSGAPPSPVSFNGGVGAVGVGGGRSLLRAAVASTVGPSPPLCTVVLRI